MRRASALTAVVLWVLCDIAAAEASRAGAEGSAPRGGTTPNVAVLMGPADPRAQSGGRIARVLAGGVLTAHVAADPDQQAGWWFVYGDDVLACGAVRLDATGHGRLSLAVPEVRARTVCRLLVRAHVGSDALEVEVFPSSMLAPAAGRLAGLRLAVADPTGRVMAALEAEKVDFEPMETDIQKLIFDGDVAILAGHQQAAALAAACRGLEGRLTRGMTVVVLNPPSQWQAWGFRRTDFEEPLSGRAHLATGFQQILQPGDLGIGPWPCAIETQAHLVPLVWVEHEDVQAGGRPSRKATVHVLAGARRVGKGRLIVAMLPQADDPVGDPVGRAVLDELLLWTARQYDTGKKEPDG